MTYVVVDSNRVAVDRTKTESMKEAFTVARVLSRSNEYYNSEIHYVENEHGEIIAMFYNGKKFIPEDDDMGEVE